MIHDVLIVGSGASAVHAAYPLVEAGLTVIMLDFGNEDRVYDSLIPNAPFLEVRKTDPQQHRYFLGDLFEGVPLGSLGVGPQLTPPRQYIIKDTQKMAPIDAQAFLPLQSLALGGMASGWAGGAYTYNDEDLKDFPISFKDLAPHYETVAERIGISGEVDDLTPFEGGLSKMLPALRVDKNGTMILNKYLQRRSKLNAAGFYMGKPRLAAVSQQYRGRGPNGYLDMSFWGDSDQSVWRPVYTLKELQSFSNFSYHRPFLVQSFKERADGIVEVISKNMKTGAIESHLTKKLILAAGIFNTTRIVLHSLDQYDVKVPFACNPYTYYPMLNINMLGKVPSEKTHSLAQLCVIYDSGVAEQPVLYCRVHSYRSLLNFKIIKEMPLPYREAMRVMKMLVSSLAILAVDHEDRPSPDKYCMLRRGPSGGSDRLEVIYSLPDDVRRQQLKYEKAIVRCFRSLGCFLLKKVWPGYGVSLHYGGTLPMSREEKDLTVNINGLLRRTRSVHIVDGSVFPYVPSKAMTFTMMANANRIGAEICKEFKQ